MNYLVLGEYIRKAREAARMSQDDLACRMEVRQEAVNGWERGISRPSRRQLPKLCSVLELNLAAVLKAGSYKQEKNNPSQNRLLNLPFENLSPEAFEAFCRDLFQMRYPRRTAVRNGSSGYKQYGVDIYVDGENERIGIQCKRHKRFGPSNVKKAIDGVLPDAQLSSGIIALSRRSATPAARLEANKHPGWALWDGETLSGFVRELQTDKKLALIDSYFPELRESFLGIPEPSPWLEPKRYDTTLAGRLGVDRNFTLVGRGEELQKLTDLVTNHYQVALVIGRGGIGKSRLLREFATSYTDRDVRFVARGQLAPSAFDLLPEGAPVVVVDDATDAEHDVAALVDGICRARPGATVVLAARPRAIPKLRESLGQLEQDADDVTVSVGDLSIEDAESLAREALGDHATDVRVESLAQIGYDCPFLIITGAHLVRSGKLSDVDLASQTVLRSAILTRFTDLVLSGANADARTAVLQSLAAIQPAPLGDGDFIECLGAISGQPRATLLEILDELEDFGLVLRRGKTVRVVPDLLGDATLERALVSKSGFDKQFAQRVAGHARGSALTHAIHNVSIVDWHRRTDGDSNLADVLWSALADNARDLPNSARITISKGIAAVAAIYPDRALDFADMLLSQPAADENDDLSGPWGKRTFSSEDVARSLAPVIANAGHQIDFLPRALRSLLDIGLEDDSSEDINPKHALRLARELGEFHPRRPVKFTKRYVEIIGEVLRTDEYPEHRDRVASLLKSALAVEVTVTSSKGFDFTISNQRVVLENVADVRSAAIGIAEELLVEDSRAARVAIELLKEALNTGGPAGSVTEEFVQVVDILGRVLSDPNQFAGLRLSAHLALRRLATYGEGDQKKVARDWCRKLYVDDELRFIRLVRADWDEYDEDDAQEFSPSSRVRVREGSGTVADELAEQWSTQYTPRELVGRLRETLGAEYSASNKVISPEWLLEKVFQKAPNAAHIVIGMPIKGLVDHVLVRVALSVLLEAGDEKAEQAALEMIAHNGELAQNVACVVMKRAGALNHIRRNVVRALLGSSDPRVHLMLLSDARWLEPSERSLIFELLSAAPIETEPAVAKAALAVLKGDVISWQSLTKAERHRLLERLEFTPHLPAYELGQLLKKELAVDPFAALAFLQRRIERTVSSDSSYRPIPRLEPMLLDLASNNHRIELIGMLVEWILGDKSSARQFFGMSILGALAVGYDANIQSVILGLIKSRDQDRVRIARELLMQAPMDFVIREPEFVIETLEAVGELAPAQSADVIAGLHGSAEFGLRSRSLGVDDPNEIALRDGARAIAERLQKGSIAHDFYLGVAQRASHRLEEERRDDESLRDRRSWR